MTPAVTVAEAAALAARILLAGSIASEMAVRGMKNTIRQDVPKLVLTMNCTKMTIVYLKDP